MPMHGADRNCYFITLKNSYLTADDGITTAIFHKPEKPFAEKALPFIHKRLPDRERSAKV
ncbi:MAG: hypothetical protein Q4D61_03645 [Cardiobacteriaceae bacterium]|nr:hypothetical protein [Cardiobacteriaceae bacterium]